MLKIHLNPRLELLKRIHMADQNPVIPLTLNKVSYFSADVKPSLGEDIGIYLIISY